MLSSHVSVSARCEKTVGCGRACGRKEDTSKVPRWRCVTGISRGVSSAVRTDERDVRAELMRDSGAWKAGLSEDMMEGVRNTTDGLAMGGGGPALVFGCEKGRLCRSGRNDWRVRMGVRTRVLRRSEMVVWERAAMGDAGYVVDGMMRRERKVRW